MFSLPKLPRLIVRLTTEILLMGWCLCVSAAPIDANTASVQELDSIHGIGPRMAERITTERKASSFRDWLDLIDRVHGMGPLSAQKFSNSGLTVNGALYRAEASAPQGTRSSLQTGKQSGKGVIMTFATPPTALPAPSSAASPKAASASPKQDKSQPSKASSRPSQFTQGP